MKPCMAGPTVWSEFSALATETGAINLGQGFPNWEPPDFVISSAHKSLDGGFNQYTRTAGHPLLVTLLAKRYSMHFRRHVDPFNEVAVTIGASQALYVTFMAILSPGDEVVLFEPFFDLYLGQIRMAGGVVKSVPLKVEEGEWQLDVARLRSAVTPKTRAVVVNTPHNPTGKVFTREELEEIAGVVRDNPRLLVVSDEVYKYMVYSGTDQDEPREEAPAEEGLGAVLAGGLVPPLRHVHFSTLPGMGNRTVTVSSAGKTFSVTGWQVGWVVGPKRVVQEIQRTLPYMQFCVSTPLQAAMCDVLIQAERPYKGHPDYYNWLCHQYAEKRARLEAILNTVGIPTLKGEGGFFIIGDVSSIQVPEDYLTQGTPAMPVMVKDWAFCRWMAKEHGLVAIPTSAFFSAESREAGIGDGLVRFCFCKTDETLSKASEALRNMARSQARIEPTLLRAREGVGAS
ncbi:unnamed protein product [Discosporangium mesarthrocarpum]